MSSVETALRAQGDALLFSLFGATITILAILETRAAMRAGVDRMHRWPANIALTLMNVAVMGVLPLSGLAVADFARDTGTGIMNLWPVPLWVGLTVSFLAFSLQSWAVHLTMHKLPVLWRFHRVHHTDTQLDVSTTVRFHPLEIALQAPISAAVVLAIGAPPAAAILYGIFDALVNAFSHANLHLPRRLDSALAWLIVTPHLHRIHHSPLQPETDSNFGATLPLWDRLFGTFRSKSPEALALQGIGLSEMQDERAHSLIWALTLPFRPILRNGRIRPIAEPEDGRNLRIDP